MINPIYILGILLFIGCASPLIKANLPENEKIIFQGVFNKSDDWYICDISYMNKFNFLKLDESKEFDFLHPSLSPNGEELMFIAYPKDYILKHWEGKNYINIYNFKTNSLDVVMESIKNYRSTSFSPNGDEILFTEFDKKKGIKELIVMSKDGENSDRLELDNLYFIDPAWSPNGDEIVFLGRHQDLREFNIYIIKRDGSNLRMIPLKKVLPLKKGDHPMWACPKFSPDGEKIAFTDSGNMIYIISKNGTFLNKIELHWKYSIDSLDWSPDGKRFVFSYYKLRFLYDPLLPDELSVIDIDGKNLKVIFKDKNINPYYPQWWIKKKKE